MTSLRKGFIAAGAIHGALLTLWLGYELTGKIYRENLRLDFTLTAGGGAGGKNSTAQETKAPPEKEGEQSQTSPANPLPGAPAKGSGTQPGDGYAHENMSSISGLIHGRVYYPRIARKNNWQGRVLVHFVVGTDGKTSDVALRESSGHRVLDESAIETIRELDGLPKPPVPVPLTVPVYFRLN